jgi:LEA14-like dessication related protein
LPAAYPLPRASVWGRACALAFLLALCGCAALVPRLEPPQLEVAGVSVSGNDLARVQIGVRLHVSNPNARAIAVQTIDCRLALAGTEFAQGATTAPFVVPAQGATDFEVKLDADLAAALTLMAAQLGARDVPYTVTGEAHLAQGLIRTLPFKHAGKLSLR